MTLSKPYLVCICYDKYIYAKKCGWKFGSVRMLLVGECIYRGCPKSSLTICHKTNIFELTK